MEQRTQCTRHRGYKRSGFESGTDLRNTPTCSAQWRRPTIHRRFGQAANAPKTAIHHALQVQEFQLHAATTSQPPSATTAELASLDGHVQRVTTSCSERQKHAQKPSWPGPRRQLHGRGHASGSFDICDDSRDFVLKDIEVNDWVSTPRGGPT